MKKKKAELYQKLIKSNFLGLKKFYIDTLAERKFREITMDISSVCNAKCPYCPRQREGHPFKNNDIMSEEVFNTIFKQLEKLPKVRTINLYAYGEPLLNKNAGKFIQKLRTLKNRYLVLSTNTTNMEKFTEDLMLLDKIQFSIEGWDKESYEKTRVNLVFEETLEKIKNFDIEIKKRRASGLCTPKRVIHCLYTKNANLEAFVKLWSPYVDEMRFTPLGTYSTWDNGIPKQHQIKELENDIFNYYEKKDLTHYCSYVKRCITLNSAGKVVLCCSDFEQNLNLGDYSDLVKAFKNPFFKNLARKMILNEPNYCDACVLQYKIPIDEIHQFQPNIEKLKNYNTKDFKVNI